MEISKIGCLLRIGTIWALFENGHSIPRKGNQMKEMDFLEKQRWYYATPAETERDSEKNSNGWKGPVSFAELQLLWKAVE